MNIKNNDENKIFDKNNLIFDLFDKNLIEDSYSYYKLDNTFIAFNSIDNILYLIYSNKKYFIIFYNLIDNKKINEIKKAHSNYITNFRHFLDKKNKRDLIISISAENNNIKLWNINNLECIYNYENVNERGETFSACFISDKFQNYIISSNSYLFNTEPIKIYDFNGKKIKEINDSNLNTFYINIYYDNKLSKNYIITGNYGYLCSFDYNNNKLYKKYCDDCLRINKKEHNFVIINNKEDIIELISSSFDGNIRIWDFYSGLLLKKIKIIDKYLTGICLWNEEYLFSGCEDCEIKLIDLKNEKVIKTFKGHIKEVLNIKKINHPQYGKCLLSKGISNDILHIWFKK